MAITRLGADFRIRDLMHYTDPVSLYIITHAKPGLVRFHYFSGMDSLSHVVRKTFRHFIATTNISLIGIGPS